MTKCDSWQHGVVVVTGHANGTIACWGVRYPSDMFKDSSCTASNNSSHSSHGRHGSSISRRTSSSYSTHSSSSYSSLLTSSSHGLEHASYSMDSAVSVALPGAKSSVRVAPRGTTQAGVMHPLPKDEEADIQVIPSCHMIVMKLLLEHRAPITALTVTADQRQLLSGDADGLCVKWVDDSVANQSSRNVVS
jgi:hypothetical protein